MIGIALRCVCEICIPQYGSSNCVINRWRVYVAAVLRLLDDDNAILLQRWWNLRRRNRNKRGRRAYIFQPTIGTEMNSTLRRTRVRIFTEKIQSLEARGKKRGLPRIEPVRTQIDVLGKQAFEFGSLQRLETGHTVFHLFERERSRNL